MKKHKNKNDVDIRFDKTNKKIILKRKLKKKWTEEEHKKFISSCMNHSPKWKLVKKI